MTQDQLALITANTFQWQQAIDFVPDGLARQIASGYRNIPTWDCERVLDSLVALGVLEQQACDPGTPYWMRYFRLTQNFAFPLTT
jgi:hypothetical protein